MFVAHPRLARPSWLRLPHRTARLRLPAFCAALFLGSGAALLAATYALFQRATEYRKPSLPKIPTTPAIQYLQHLQLLPQLGLAQFLKPGPPLGAAAQGLASVQHELKGFPTSNQLLHGAFFQLTQIQQQVSQDQHKLTQ